MTDEEMVALLEKLGNETINLYAKLSERVPKALVISGMTGALAACVIEAGLARENVIAALNSAFDDIEAGG